ncbi:hypothetical protein A2870_02635 [Candidatus Curtissbacteria bacterium RIFCSPHIGHO2_01_FULL_41_11]|uniref:Uncharacterized protein n=1 Tax=Candidatus Curtissbacteria bacterium RIFCSPHIGHO2_01_FULL_41_11 TaxID=1797711 RepID=A0A1F5G7V3_9BACT|nr:MAG: hypothetical protein A2870_02635 [Candidatus Curtissbacteria bacterium RIFCSPHIGHO2_01_FULL_41_11]
MDNNQITLTGANKKKYIIAAISLVVILAAVYFLFIFTKGAKSIKPQDSSGEVKSLSDVEIGKRPFVTLTPASEGAEIIISIENMSYWDGITYDLTYDTERSGISGTINQGVIGSDVNTKDPIYKKALLLGTASRGVRNADNTPDHIVTNGKLNMTLTKDEIEYNSETPWLIDYVGSKSKSFKDASGNFQFQVPLFGKDYWVIVADTVGVPPDTKDFDTKKTISPLYGVFAVTPDFPKPANISIKVDKDASNSALWTYSHADGKWQKQDSKYDSAAKTVTAAVSNFATFVVVGQ